MTTVSFPLRSPSSLPACTAADGCVLDCYATASAWECVKADGTSVPVTQGTGTTFVSTPWGYAAQIDADAEAPTITSATMEATLPGGSAAFYDGAYTIFSLANPRAVAASSAAGSYAHQDVNGGTSCYNDGNNTYGRHHAGGATGQGIVANASGRWAASVVSVSSVGAPTLRVAGSENNTTAAATAPVSPGKPLYFGRLDPVSGSGSNIGGWLARVRFYSKAFSATERATLERQAFGAVGSGGREITTARASTGWFDAPDGKVYAVASNLPRVRSDYGLLIEGARTNLLTYNTDFSNAAWAKGQFGSTLPVVTVNAATAPDGTLTADRIDFGATTNEGDYSIVGQLPAGSASATVNASVYLRTVSGTGTLYLGVIRSGAGTNVASTACALTTTWTRCTVERAASVAGGANLIMGPWSYDAAQPNAQPALSVYVWGAQLEVGFGSTSVILTGATAVQRANENFTASPVGFPGTNVQMCATLRWPLDSRDRSAWYLGNMLVDTRGAGSAPPGIQFWAWYEGGLGARFDLTTRTYTPTFPYEATHCARRVHGRSYTTVGTSTNSEATGDSVYGHSNLRFGSYSGTTLPLNGYIRDVRIGP